MRNILLLSTPILLVILSSFNDIETDGSSSKLLGSWEYLAPSISAKYQKGSMTFLNVDNELSGEVIFDDQTFPMKNLIYEDNKVRAHILFHGEKLDIFLRFETDSFKGTVSHPQGYIRISGSKTQN